MEGSTLIITVEERGEYFENTNCFYFSFNSASKNWLRVGIFSFNLIANFGWFWF